MPGIFPSCASSLKQILHKPNFRRYPRARPHRWHLVYSLTANFFGFCCLAHKAFLVISCSLARPERHPQQPQELSGLLVGFRRRHYGDIQAPRGIYRIVGNLRENKLLPKSEREVSPPVKAPWVNSPEVPHARQRDRDQTIQKLPHPFATQRDPGADRHSFAYLEPCDALPRTPELWLLAGDARQIVHRTVQSAAVLRSLAHAHVDHDLLEPRYLHHVLVSELLSERRDNLLTIALPQPSHLCRSQISCSPGSSPPSQ